MSEQTEQDEQIEYRGYVIRGRRIPTASDVHDRPEGTELANNFWAVTKQTDADMEVVIGIARTFEDAKRQIDSMFS